MNEDLAADLDPALPSLELEEEQPTQVKTAADALPPAWKTVDLPKQLAFRDKPKRRIFYDYSEVENAVQRLKSLPKREETIHAVMDSHFKGVDLVPAVLRLAKRPTAELIVTTLGFNQRDAACLCELVERGEIKRLGLVCSNFFAEKDKGAYNYAVERFAKVGARITTHRNHSKLLLFDMKPDYYVVESSANLRSCVNFEQFALSNSKPLFDFHRGWVNKML
jgi:hypothetical protein